jgi:hypothetical protein
MSDRDTELWGEEQSDADAYKGAGISRERRDPMIYPELTTALQILPSHSIQRVTEALERLMEEDAAADRSFIVNAGTRFLRLRSTSRPVRGRSARSGRNDISRR